MGNREYNINSEECIRRKAYNDHQPIQFEVSTQCKNSLANNDKALEDKCTYSIGCTIDQRTTKKALK